MQSYRIIVKSQLDSSWQPLLQGFVLQPRPNGTTVVTGNVADQAALFGVLVRLRDLGVVIERAEKISGEDLQN